MREAMRDRGVTIAAMADHLEVSVRTMHHYFQDGAEPNLTRLIAFSRALAMPVTELLADPASHSVQEGSEGNEAVSLVPIIDIGAPIEEGDLGPVVGHLGAPSRWLLDRGLSADAQRIVEVKGVGMRPTFCEGSFVMVDTRDREIANGREVYACHVGDATLVRRLEFDAISQSLVVGADNPTVPSMVFPIDSNPVVIIGRVVLSFKWQACAL